jgi:hypothetical protein
MSSTFYNVYFREDSNPEVYITALWLFGEYKSEEFFADNFYHFAECYKYAHVPTC